jgi:hypothetical protein
MDLIEFNVIFNKFCKTITLYISEDDTEIMNKLKAKIMKEFSLNKISINDLTLLSNLPTTKILTNKLILDYKNTPIDIEVLIKHRGGLGIAMFAVLIFPVIIIGIAFAAAGDVIDDFVELLGNTFEIIPLIFDPPKLIDDVLFAITSSITILFQKMGGDIKNLTSSPEDDTQETGPFGVSNSNRGAFTCMDPTWSTLLLLIVCPPLAIIYKLGFWAGFVSSIICGVLCVKLFYFPGLLFAILHVLC